MKDRADKLLVSLGLFDSRASARAAIEAGNVTAGGVVVTKPSQMLSRDDRIEAQPAHPYVSRGGLKLAHGLSAFGVDPAGRVCLDIGASTGGFTDVLLRAGATHVVAVDVGRGQLHSSLSDEDGVTSLEAQDARTLTGEMLGDTPSLLVCDASFIALEKLLAVPLSLAAERAEARKQLTAKLKSFRYQGSDIPKRIELRSSKPAIDYFRQFPGLDASAKYNNQGFRDLPIPVMGSIEVAPNDVVVYDGEGYDALKRFLQHNGIEHVLLCGYHADMCVCSTTAGHENLRRDFNVFLVGDAVQATLPANSSAQYATNQAVSFASLNVLITQASWIIPD